MDNQENMAVFSIIKKSQLEGALRLDAEYYQPEYSIDFSKGDWEYLGDIFEICQYGISKAMNVERIGFPIFKMDDINDAFLTDENIKCVDINKDEFNLYKLEKDDLLFNRVNSEEFVGRTGIFKLNGDYCFASYLIRIRIKEKANILPDYLNVFLNSRYGRKQIDKYKRRAVNQANVNAEELKKFKIKVLPEEIQKEISILSNKSWGLIEDSKKLYNQAENLLLEELGLKDYKIKDDLSCIVKLSEIKSANRIDAEFYQKKYEKILKEIKTPLKKLEELTVFLNHAKQPPYYDDGEVPIITQKNLGQFTISLESINDTESKYTNKDWLKEYPAYKLRKGDILYYSVGAYIGKTNVLFEDINATAASFITIIRPIPEIDSTYLTVVLNSMVGLLQSEKWQSATAQQYIYPKDIKNFKIPILPSKRQKQIADLVRQSHEARKKSKELLEQAKRKVEELIERQA